MAAEIAKCPAGKIAHGALELEANEFEGGGLGAAESLNGKRQALVGMISDGEHAARYIVILRPEEQERLLRSAANFPRESGEGGNAAAILANLDDAIGGEFLETRLQFGGEVHAEKY